MHVIDNHSPPYLWRQGLPHEPRAPHQIVQLASLHQRSPVSTSCALGLQLSPYVHPAFTWMLGIWTRVFTLAWPILNLWGTALNLCFLVTFSWVKSYLETQNVTVINLEADMIRPGAHCVTCLPFFSTKPPDTWVRAMRISLKLTGNLNSGSSLNQKWQLGVEKKNCLGNSRSFAASWGLRMVALGAFKTSWNPLQ